MKKFIKAKLTSTETNTNNTAITEILEEPTLSPPPSDNSKQENIDYTTNESNNIPKKHKHCICNSNNTLDNSKVYQGKCHTPLDECYGQYDIAPSQSEGHFDTSNEYQNNSYVDNSQNIYQDSYSYIYNNAISQAGPSNNAYAHNTMYQSPSTSSNIYEMHCNSCVLPPPPTPPEEPESDISNNSSLSTQSLNNGLNSIGNMPSTSKGTNELSDIVNFLSNSSNQELIEILQRTITQSQPGDSDPDYLVIKCNHCDYSQYRLEYYKEKVEKMRSTKDTLKKKTEMLDEHIERLNNTLSAFEKLAISKADPLNGAVATLDLLKEKIMYI